MSPIPIPFLSLYSKSSSLNGRAIEEKGNFFTFTFYLVAKFQRPLSSGGGEALMARPLREELILAASLSENQEIADSLF